MNGSWINGKGRSLPTTVANGRKRSVSLSETKPRINATHANAKYSRKVLAVLDVVLAGSTERACHPLARPQPSEG
jgi:hypothetical protein